MELKEKGNCSVRKILLHPKTKLAVLKDKLENLLSEAYQEFRTGYYLSIRVTDEEILEYPVQRLQQVFSGMWNVGLKTVERWLRELWKRRICLL